MGAFAAPNWSVGLDYQLTPETLLYINSRHGYVAGGFNTTSPVLATQRFNPQYTTDVELGVKSENELYGVKTRTNADIFIGMLKSIQINTQFLNQSNRVPYTVTGNGGNADIDGAEFEETVIPMKGVEATLSYSYNLFKPGTCNVGLTPGIVDPIFQTLPKNKFNASLIYHLPVDESLGDISGTINWSYRSGMSLSSAVFRSTIIGEAVPPLSLLNVHIDWANIFGQSIDASFFMTNMTDRLYRIGSFALIGSGLGFQSDVYGEPRMFGFSLKYRFDEGA